MAVEDFGPIIDKPLQIGGNVLAQMTKKVAASHWARFKRLLSTASEPLLRKDGGRGICQARPLRVGR